MADKTVMIGGMLMTTATFIGPDVNAIVAAGSTGTVTLTLSSVSGARRISDILGLLSITGLPNGIAIVGFEVDKVKNQINIYVLNTTAADITIAAGSVSSTAVVLAY